MQGKVSTTCYCQPAILFIIQIQFSDKQSKFFCLRNEVNKLTTLYKSGEVSFYYQFNNEGVPSKLKKTKLHKRKQIYYKEGTTELDYFELSMKRAPIKQNYVVQKIAN